MTDAALRILQSKFILNPTEPSNFFHAVETLFDCKFQKRNIFDEQVQDQLARGLHLEALISLINPLAAILLAMLLFGTSINVMIKLKY